MKTADEIRRERQRLKSLEPKLIRSMVITDNEAARARKMRSKGKTWDDIAKRLDIPRDDLVQRCDRVEARKLGLRAPSWLYQHH